ncbi:SdiA-regulated domain-containing protein [Lacinutrix salivirga]
MKITKSNIPEIIIIALGVFILVMQRPVTEAIVKRNNKIDKKFSSIYKIKNTYELPEQLDEISGIEWINNMTFAGIQDEDGIIFIYDAKTNRIIKQINFGDPGDYEAIAINKQDAYVMRSDGVIFKIKNYESEDREISKHKTPFSENNNIESLTYDRGNNKLLITPKDTDLEDKDSKSIYQISLQTMQMDSIPYVKINLKDKALKDFKHKNIERTFNPSDIAVHPITKDIYVLEGKNPKLLILNSKGELTKALPLDERRFAQPEGITFSADGRLFISNEADDDKANIMELELK